MKTLNYSVVLLMLLLFYSCKKESIPVSNSSNLSSMNNQFDIQGEAIGTPPPQWSIDKIESSEEATAVMAQAISKALEDDVEFRNFCYNNRHASPAYFLENFIIGIADSILFGTETFKDFIMPYFDSEIVLLYGDQIFDRVLAYAPTLMFKFPSEFMNIIGTNATEFSPLVLFKGFDGNVFLLNGDQYIHDDPNQGVFFLLVQNSENHLLVDESTLETSFGEELKYIVGQYALDCPSVISSISSSPLAFGETGYKVIRIKEDLQDIYFTSCGYNDKKIDGPNGDPNNPPPPPPPGGCHRDDTNWNAWEGCQFKGWNDIQFLRNPTCRATEEKIDLFMAFAYATETGSGKFKKRLRSADIAEFWEPPVYHIEYKWKWVWNWLCLCYLPKQIPFTVKDSDGYTKYFDFSQVVFSKLGDFNDWRLDNHGTQFVLEVREIDNITCSTSESKTITFGFDFTVEMTPVGGGAKYSRQVKETVVTKGTAETDIFLHTYFYCDHFDSDGNAFDDFGTIMWHYYCPLL